MQGGSPQGRKARHPGLQDDDRDEVSRLSEHHRHHLVAGGVLNNTRGAEHARGYGADVQGSGRGSQKLRLHVWQGLHGPQHRVQPPRTWLQNLVRFLWSGLSGRHGQLEALPAH